MKVCSVCDRCFDDFETYCSDAGHPPLEGTLRGRPEMIDGYRLDALLLSGLKGDAYRAFHIASGRSCLIRIPVIDEKSREGFLRDADFAATIFHPNVADIYESGFLETGECYVVAEDPSGQSLRQLLNEVGAPSLLTSIQVVRQAAEAVHALHLKGLTHGALCPENIILTSDAEHRLMVRIQNPDFGGAGQSAIVCNKFFIDSAVDSLRYFAPEQCSGEPAGNKADVYSLGVILYEMLAGTPPFEEPTAAALIEKHKNQRPPDVRIDNFDLRMLLAHTLMESLSKRPEQRQSSANAFARQMRHIEQLATHVSTPPPVVAVAPLVRPSVSAPAVRQIVQPKEIEPAANPVLAGTDIGYGEVGEMGSSPLPPAVIQRDAPPVYVEVVPAQRGTEFTAIENVPNENRESIPERTEIPTAPIEALPVPIVETAGPTEGLREESAPSRLKLHRRKLHSRTVPVGSGEQNTNPIDPVDADVFMDTRAYMVPAASVKVSTREEQPVHAAPPARPVRIEWVQPEDDIPSMADVQAVLLSEGLNVPVALEPIPAREEIAIAATPAPVLENETIAAPNKPETTLAKKRIAVSTAPEPVPLAAVAPAPERKETAPKAAKPAARAPVIAKTSASVVATGSFAPRKREVALKTAPRRSQEAVFFPTILGNVENSDVFIPDSSGGILSAYNSASAARFSIPNRGLMIGSGILVFVVLVLFGGDSIQRLASLEPPGDSVAAKSAAATSAEPEKVAAETMPGMTANRPVPETRVADTLPPARTEARDPAAARTSEPRRATGRQNERKTLTTTAPVSGGDRREPIQNTVSAGKASRTIQAKAAGATRPRIVKVAEP